MRVGECQVISCDCEGTMPLDAAALAMALGTAPPAIATRLYRRRQANLEGQAKLEGPVRLQGQMQLEGQDLRVACAQERAVFEEVLAETTSEAAADAILTPDIRARAARSPVPPGRSYRLVEGGGPGDPRGGARPHHRSRRDLPPRSRLGQRAHRADRGKAFGVKSSIDRITARFEGQHWMYRGAASPRVRLGMCADCRVVAQSGSDLDPYAGPALPKPETADDYRD